MKRELSAAGGDDREGEVGQDVEELLPQGILGGHAALVPGDPCGGCGVEVVGRGMVPGVPAVERDTGNGGDIGAGGRIRHGADDGTEIFVLFIGEEGVEIFPGGGWLRIHERGGGMGHQTSDVRRQMSGMVGEFCGGASGGAAGVRGRGERSGMLPDLFGVPPCFFTPIGVYIYTKKNKYSTREYSTEHMHW